MLRLKQLNTEDCIFFDIESAPEYKQLPDTGPVRDSWIYKMKYEKENVESGKTTYEQLYDDKAALYPEFSKVVAITLGKVKDNAIKLFSIAGHEEDKVLNSFNKVINGSLSQNKGTKLVGFAISQFDIPFLLKRCIILGIAPNQLIDINHLKPWNCDTFIIDLKTLWRGGSATDSSLINVAIALGLPSPKSDMEGAQVHKIYYSDPDPIKRISNYCDSDVVTNINIFQKCRFEPVLEVANEELEAPKPVGAVEKLFNTGDEAAAKTVVKLAKTLSGRKAEIAKELIDIVTNK
jgi:predicted PolB exonuclease-like 3'-5' exonuclease